MQFEKKPRRMFLQEIYGFFHILSRRFETNQQKKKTTSFLRACPHILLTLFVNM